MGGQAWTCKHKSSIHAKTSVYSLVHRLSNTAISEKPGYEAIQYKGVTQLRMSHAGIMSQHASSDLVLEKALFSISNIYKLIRSFKVNVHLK